MGSSKPDAKTAGIRVLIVDDHALFRRGLREHLEASGLNVVGEAEDAAGAVDLFAETEPEVILMDLRMPGGPHRRDQGMLLAAPDAHILLMTVSTEEEKVIEAIIAGACGYLLKDSDGDQIVAAIGTASAGESALSPRIASALIERLRGARTTAGLRHR